MRDYSTFSADVQPSRRFRVPRFWFLVNGQPRSDVGAVILGRKNFLISGFHSRGRLCYMEAPPAAPRDSWTIADNADTASFETVYTQRGNDEFKSMNYALDYRSCGGRPRSVPFSAASAPSAVEDSVSRNESKRSQAGNAERDAT